jgi:Transposase DDE domain.
MRVMYLVNKFLANVLRKGVKQHYSMEDISSVLLTAAYRRSTVNSVSRSPDPDTVFIRLKDIDLDRLASIVMDTAPRIKGKVMIAIDGHDEMFYGDEDVDMVIGTGEKAGSYRAFKYLAVKLIRGEEAYFVYLQPMSNGSVVDAAISSLEKLGRKYDIDTVLMDGEFFSSRLLNHFDGKGIHFVCRRRSLKRLRDVPYEKPVKTRMRGKSRKDRPDTVEVEYYLYRYHGRGGKDFFLASDMKKDAEELRKLFKKRWGIETGFREVNRLKIRTISRDWRIRLLFYAISMWLYNQWLSVRGYGMTRLDSFRMLIVREIDKALFRLKVVFKYLFYRGAI